MTKMEMERMEEFQNMTPGDAWDIFVGSQPVHEFVEVYQDQGIMDFGDMVYDYVYEGLDVIFPEDAPYSETEKQIIYNKLLKYIEYVYE